MSDEKNLPGVTADDPNVPNDEEAAAELAAQKLLIREVTGEEDADPEEEVAAPEETPPADAAAPQTNQTPEERAFSQADLERIIGERLGRDRKVQAVRQLESVAGQPIEDLVQAYRDQQVERAQEQFAMTEDEALAYVTQQEELRTYKSEREALRQQQEAYQQMMAYQQSKQQLLATTPLARQYEAEIDQFSGMGSHLPFDAAMAYILGQKVLSGEVLQNVQRAAQAKTLADVQKRRAVAPESAAASGPSEGGLTPQERVIASRLGLSAKEYQESRTRIQKTRAQRG